MEFRIADTFTESLAKLTGQERKAVKTAAFDLQIGPSARGLSFHKLDRARDPNFWSVRVNADIRLIVHRTAASLLLAYVGHNDAAYQWAARPKLERHPATGAMQLIELTQSTEDTTAGWPPAAPGSNGKPKPPLFAAISESVLLGYGVPAEWPGEVRKVNEDTLFDLVEHLPGEAAHALLELAVGETPKPRTPLKPSADPFEHPDALRRFHVLTRRSELEEALKTLTAVQSPQSKGRAPMSLPAFQSLWDELRQTLKPGIELSGWGAKRGFTSMRFRVVDIGPGFISVDSDTMWAPRRISKGDFVKLYAVWNDYCAGSISRQKLAMVSQNSSYIFAILRWYEDSRTAAGNATRRGA